MCTFQVTFFSFIMSRSLEIRCHILTTVRPGKVSLTSTLLSQKLDGQLDDVAAQGSSFIRCTTLDKTLRVLPPSL